MPAPDPNKIAAAINNPPAHISPGEQRAHEHRYLPKSLSKPKSQQLADKQVEEELTPTTDWFEAPATSHVATFRYYEVPSLSALDMSLGGERYQLQVYFKNSARGYRYFFQNRQEAMLVFDEMRRSMRPYGEVLYPKVIRPGIPFNSFTG